MKNYLNIKIVALLFIAFLAFSCDDDEGGISADVDTSIVPELRNGVFIRFSDGQAPPATLSFAVPTEAAFTLPMEDVNNNAVLYTIDLTAILSGNTIMVEDAYTFTSFPATLDINMTQVAEILGVTLDDINFGDNFAFVGTGVDAEGRESVGLLPSLDNDTLIPGLGTTIDPLLNEASFNSAMNFNFTLACPAFVVDDVVGTYDVTAQAFFPDAGADLLREVIAGPGENQVTIVGGEYVGLGSDDLIITFDPSTGSVTAVNNDGVSLPASAGFGVNTYLLENGLVLPCAGTGLIDLRLNFTPLNGNPHDFILQKQ